MAVPSEAFDHQLGAPVVAGVEIVEAFDRVAAATPVDRAQVCAVRDAVVVERAEQIYPDAVGHVASALGVSQGDINAASPPAVEPGSYVVQLDKNNTTPYDVDLSAQFSIS